MMATMLCIDIPAFLASERGQWDALLDACDALSPLLDDDRPGRLFAQMRGTPGGSQQWMDLARAICAAHGYRAYVGIGPNRFVAGVVARYADGACWEEAVCAQRLAPLPLAALAIDPAIIERLGLLGVQTLGALAALPHGPFVRRFGAIAATWHSRARGIDATPLRPRARRCAIEASLLGEGSVTTHEQVLFALRSIIGQIVADCERAGLRAGRLDVHFEMENGDAEDVPVAFAAPTADARTLFDVVRARLEGHQFEAPISALRIRLHEFDEGGQDIALFADESHDPQVLAATLGRLRARHGAPVQRARVQEAHLLERRFSYDVFPVAVARKKPESAFSHEAFIPQLRLLRVREVHVVVARGAPVSVDGRRVCAVAGPWRVNDGWYEGPMPRDEYDVQLEDATLARIYRQGGVWYLRATYD
ncbi:MAG: DinB/UmuC family translesion DNA polymerase [Vulcanimicrobiaceae bacterium]